MQKQVKENTRAERAYEPPFPSTTDVGSTFSSFPHPFAAVYPFCPSPFTTASLHDCVPSRASRQSPREIKVTVVTTRLFFQPYPATPETEPRSSLSFVMRKTNRALFSNPVKYAQMCRMGVCLCVCEYVWKTLLLTTVINDDNSDFAPGHQSTLIIVLRLRHLLSHKSGFPRREKFKYYSRI